MCTCLCRSVDRTDKSDIGLKSMGFNLSLVFGSGITFAFLNSEGKTFFSMHGLKIEVSDSNMYGSDNSCNWLLIPSGPDDFLFSSLDICLPRVFCSHKSCRIS